jgi:signal transduction histidine kinase
MGISSLYLITPQNQNFDFFLLLNISIAAIVAANATHLTPVISTFKRFFLFLGILKSRHHLAYGRRDVDRSDAEPAVRFCDLPSRVNVACLFIQQARLEEESARLAEQFRQAKEEAEQALRDKNQFLTTASHDLRQPVHAMGFLIEAIIHKNSNDALMPQLLDLQQSVRSVQLMFNSLLDLSKIESGNMMTTTTHVDIGALLDSVITLFREEAKSRGLDSVPGGPVGAST